MNPQYYALYFIFVIGYKTLLTSNASVPYLLINLFPIFGVFYLLIRQIKPLLSFTFAVFYIFVEKRQTADFSYLFLCSVFLFFQTWYRWFLLSFFMFCVSVFLNIIPLFSLIFFMFCVSVFPNIIPLISLIFFYVLCFCFLKHNTAVFSYLFYVLYFCFSNIIPLISLISFGVSFSFLKT